MDVPWIGSRRCVSYGRRESGSSDYDFRWRLERLLLNIGLGPWRLSKPGAKKEFALSFFLGDAFCEVVRAAGNQTAFHSYAVDSDGFKMSFSPFTFVSQSVVNTT